MAYPVDIVLYDKIKKNIILKYLKNSAYRSGLIVKKYKKEFFIKYNNHNAYTGNRIDSNLYRWYKEKWINQRNEIGYKKKGDIYRPSVKINDKTPTTWKDLTFVKIKKAIKEKKENGRVKSFKKL